MTKKNQNVKELETIEKTFTAFKLLNKNEQIEIIKKSLLADTIEIKDNLIESYNNGFKEAYLLCLYDENLDREKVEKILSSIDFLKFDKIKIITKNKANCDLKFIINLDIEIIDKFKLYEIFQSNNININYSFLNVPKKKFDFKKLLKKLFQKEKAKSYFFCALILLFSSLVLPYHFYYLIFGTLLIVFSLVCRLSSLIDW